MHAALSREQMSSYVRQAAIELLEGPAPAGYDLPQALASGKGVEGSSQKPDVRSLMSRAEVFRLLD